MGIILDVILIAAFALSVFLGYKKGLIGVAFKIVSFIIAIVLALLLSRPVSNIIIEHTEIDENIHNTVQDTLKAKDKEENKEAENAEISNVITNYIAEQVKELTSSAQNEVASIIADNLTSTIINGLSFIGIYIIARIVLFFFKFLAESLAELPVVKQFNEAGGIIYGILRGAFLICLLFTIISLLASIVDISGFLEIINTSFIGSLIYNNNILLNIVLK